MLVVRMSWDGTVVLMLLQVGRWSNLYETTVRLVEDIRYIMSHGEVPKYVIHEVPDMSRTWMELLSLVQGMDPQKRVTGLHVEDENENMHTPFVLGNSIGNINSLLVAGAFSLDDAEEIMLDLDECDNLRHAKVGRLSEQSSISSTTGRSSSSGHSSEVSGTNWKTRSYLSVPSSVTWLIFECLKAIENLLVHCASSKKLLGSLVVESNEKTPTKILPQSKSLLKIQKGRDLMWGDLNEPYGYVRRSNDSNECHGIHGLSSSVYGRSLASQDDDTMDAEDMDLDNCSSSAVSSGNNVEAQCTIGSGVVGLLNQKEWPEITYDVSSEEISFHIPLHRLLSQLLQKALKKCYGDAESVEIMNAIPAVSLPVDCHDFFQQVLKGCHHVGFASFLMEHPLRLRVFCAEVRAGMWRKNGEAVILSCEWYRSARWWKEGLEFDLFLLQCCAALAPPELFVKRILERFGLSGYLSMNIERSSEYSLRKRFFMAWVSFLSEYCFSPQINAVQRGDSDSHPLDDADQDTMQKLKEQDDLILQPVGPDHAPILIDTVLLRIERSDLLEWNLRFQLMSLKFGNQLKQQLSGHSVLNLGNLFFKSLFRTTEPFKILQQQVVKSNLQTNSIQIFSINVRWHKQKEDIKWFKRGGKDHCAVPVPPKAIIIVKKMKITSNKKRSREKISFRRILKMIRYRYNTTISYGYWLSPTRDTRTYWLIWYLELLPNLLAHRHSEPKRQVVKLLSQASALALYQLIDTQERQQLDKVYRLRILEVGKKSTKEPSNTNFEYQDLMISSRL
ncbi:hypothetical protein ACLOJK_012842 [Asimina triloba]